MPLYGTFDTMSLADVFQWIGESRADGTLVVAVDIDETILSFVQGDLVGVTSGDSLRIDLGQYLLRQGIISEALLQQSVKAGGGRIASKKTLVASGELAYRTLVEKEHAFALDIVLDLFFYTDGAFHFSIGGQSEMFVAETNPPERLEQPIPSRTILMDGMRRLDDWARIKEVFPSSFTVVRAVGDGGDNPLWRKLADLGAPMAIGDVCLRIQMGRFAVYQGLFELHKNGLVEIDEINPGAPNFAHLGPVENLVEDAAQLFGERQFDEAREILATVLSLEPDNKIARGLLKNLRVEHLAYLYQMIPPHKTPVLAISRMELLQVPLSQKEMFLAEHINGQRDVGMLVVATPLGELETLRILQKLLHARICVLR